MAEVIERSAQGLLEAEVVRVEGGGARVAGAHLRMGPPADAVLDVAEEVGAGLILMGGRGHGPIERLLLGSVAMNVVHHAHCPVLVLRGGDGAWPPARVIVGEGGSEPSRAAGELAALIGGLFGASGLLVRSYPELPEVDPKGRASDARTVDDELRREERALEARAAEMEAATGFVRGSASRSATRQRTSWRPRGKACPRRPSWL